MRPELEHEVRGAAHIILDSGRQERGEAFRKTLSPMAQAVLVCSWQFPARVVRVEHLLASMLLGLEGPYALWLESYPPEAREQAAAERLEAAGRSGFVLQKLGVDLEQLQNAVVQAMQLEPMREPNAKPRQSRDWGQVWRMAGEEARLMGSPLVWPEHVLLAILSWSRPRSGWSVWPHKRDQAAQVLAGLSIDLEPIRIGKMFLSRAGFAPSSNRTLARLEAPLPTSTEASRSASNRTLARLEEGDSPASASSSTSYSDRLLDVARVVVRGLIEREIGPPEPWTERVQKAIDAAHAQSIKTHCGRIAPPHLLLALLRDDEDAREGCKYLGLEDIDLEALRASLSRSIHSDGEASGPKPRFSKDSARVLDKAKAMCRRAGLKRMDEAALLLCLALHGGESVEAWRQVLGEQRAREQVKKWYPRRRVPSEPEPQMMITAGRVPWRSPLNLAAFWVAMLGFPLGVLLLSLGPPLGVRRSVTADVGLSFVGVELLGMAVCVLGILIGRPRAFKAACVSFASGLITLITCFILCSWLWSGLKWLMKL